MAEFDEESRRKLEEWARDVLKSPDLLKYFYPIMAGRTCEEVIEDVREHGVSYTASTLRNAVLGGIEVLRKKGPAENLVKVGCASYGTILMVRYYCLLLQKLGIDYALLQKEYCCLPAPLYLTLAQGGDRSKVDELSRQLQSEHIAEAHRRGTKNIVYFCQWCALRNKWLFSDSDINQLYQLDILTEPQLWEGKRLRLSGTVGYYGGPTHRKGIYEPTGSVELNWQEYRKLLNRIEGLTVVDIPRYCCHVSLQPIWQWVEDHNLDTVVVSCPTCYGNLTRHAPPGVRIRSMSEILLDALGEQPW
ncbi:hypothetical protein ACFLV4_02665 [Chloroflexota bacterium]